MTIQDVARLLGLGWDAVKEIHKRDLSERYAEPPLDDLRYMSIDEISVSKGHKYLTLVMNLESGAVVFVGDGKGAEALTPFWERLKVSTAKIRAVSTDMSAAYIDAVKKNCQGYP